MRKARPLRRSDFAHRPACGLIAIKVVRCRCAIVGRMNHPPDPRPILVINGHPDAAPGHYVGALADAYCAGAIQGGHRVERVDIATLDFAVLRSAHDWEFGAPPPAIAAVQEKLLRCRHVVLLYPLWLGDLPALAKAFLEQVARPSFVRVVPETGQATQPLHGRSARLIVTMGMPAFFYRLFYRSHSLKSLERNVLRFVGIRPVKSTVIGSIEDEACRAAGLAKVRALGVAAA